MVEKLQKKISESNSARWIVLFAVSFTLLTGYIISDVVSPLKPILTQNGWSSTDFGWFNFGYGMFNVFLAMLIIGGVILDKRGPRFSGFLSIFLMIVGTSVKYWALSTTFPEGSMVNIFGWELQTQVFMAMVGFGIFGVGIEMLGITANKIIVRWFTGKSLALAIGLNVSAGRIGTALATAVSLPIATAFGGSVSAPLAVCLVFLLVGLVSFMFFAVLDAKLDREEGIKHGSSADSDFKFSNIRDIASIKAFWLITMLCLMFYSAVFPFLKFATEFMIMKYGVDPKYAGLILSLLPLGNMILTPLFGSIYDRKGKGATIMIIGSIMLVGAHTLFAIPAFSAPWVAICLMMILGGAFSLVPSAMWPSVPKIIPYNMLGTAYSMIFWVQNIGLMLVPLLIGKVLDAYCNTGEMMMVSGKATIKYDYTIPMLIFTVFGVISIFLAFWLKHEDRVKGYGLELPNIKK